MKWRNLLVVLAALLSFQAVQAQTFTVKGVLRDPLGRTVDDGVYQITFKLYDAATDGNKLWEETQDNVQVQHGVFGVELGSVTSLSGVTFLTTLWLGIVVESSEELEPRIKLAPTPYSLAVLGVGNRFPSDGNVGVGVLAPVNKMDVAGAAAIGAGYAGSATAPTNGMVVQGSVGIGTNAPTSPLEVNGDIRLSAGSLIFPDGTSINTTEVSGDAGAMSNPTDALVTADNDADGSGGIQFRTGSSTDMVVANDGRVGIGTTSPTAPLDVNGTAHFSGNVITLGNGSFIGYNAELQRSSSLTSPDVFASDGGLVLGGNDSGGGYVAMNGNMGIGTISPAAKLSFSNVGDVSEATGITWYNPAPTNYGIHRTAGAWTGPSYQQLRLSWHTGIVLDAGTGSDKNYVDINGGEGLRVTSGNVGIGTASASWPLHVVKNQSGRPQVVNIENLSDKAGDGATLIFGVGGCCGTGSIGSVITQESPRNADVRISTISGGSWNNDVLTVTSGGAVGISRTSPTATLDVNGDAKVGGKFVPGGEENLRIVRGIINADGSIAAGSGFFVSRPGTTGEYRVDFTPQFSAEPTVTLAVHGTTNISATMGISISASIAKNNTQFGVTTTNASSSARHDIKWEFIAMGPR